MRRELAAITSRTCCVCNVGHDAMTPRRAGDVPQLTARPSMQRQLVVLVVLIAPLRFASPARKVRQAALGQPAAGRGALDVSVREPPSGTDWIRRRGRGEALRRARSRRRRRCRRSPSWGCGDDTDVELKVAIGERDLGAAPEVRAGRPGRARRRRRRGGGFGPRLGRLDRRIGQLPLAAVVAGLHRTYHDGFGAFASVEDCSADRGYRATRAAPTPAHIRGAIRPAQLSSAARFERASPWPHRATLFGPSQVATGRCGLICHWIDETVY